MAMTHARELVGRGHSVTVLTTNVDSLRPRRRVPRESVEVDGVAIRYFPAHWLAPKFALVWSTELVAWVRQHCLEFDVFHVHFAREWVPLSVVRALRGRVPFVLQTHGMLGRRGGLRSFVDSLVVRESLLSAAGVLSLQRVEDGELTKVAEKVRLVRLGNGVPTTTATARTLPANREWTILFLARLHPRKRVLAFLAAAEAMLEKGVSARFRVVGPDGGDLAAAIALAERGPLRGRVKFVGAVSPKGAAEEFIKADLYILPSVNEPFPMTVLEALSQGVPTIVTDSCHIATELGELKAALVTPPNAEAIAETAASIFESAELYSELSANGLRASKTYFNVDTVTDLLEGALQRAIRFHPADNRGDG